MNPYSHRRIAILLGFQALTLAVISPLHLSGVLSGGRKPFVPTDGGIAEAVILFALLAGVVALVRQSKHARAVALGATAFAIVGFIVGLNFTVRGGNATDIAYHSTLLPLLALTFAALLRRRERVSADHPVARTGAPELDDQLPQMTTWEPC